MTIPDSASLALGFHLGASRGARALRLRSESSFGVVLVSESSLKSARACARDGLTEASALTAEILRHFHEDPVKVIGWMDRATATDYATFAPLVMRYADQGDPVGRRIVQAGANQIDGLVRALFKRGARRVALTGTAIPLRSSKKSSRNFAPSTPDLWSRAARRRMISARRMRYSVKLSR